MFPITTMSAKLHMKNLLQHYQTIALITSGILAAQMAAAQTETWTGGGANQNWSTIGNWSSAVVPNSLTNVIFTNNTGAATSPGTVDSIMDSGFTGSIASLQFANTNIGGTGAFHTVQIGAGQTLTVLSNLIVSTLTDDGKSCLVNASFTGAGTLLVSNVNAYVDVSQGSAAGSGPAATLNLTNLNNFNATIGGFVVGVYNTPNPTLARQCGLVYLAKTNTINLLGTYPKGYGNESQIEIGENLGNGGTASMFYLGLTNGINVNSITVAADKQTGIYMLFNPVFTNNSIPTAYFRGTNGSASRVSTWKVADDSGQTTSGSASSSGTVDFTGGALDTLVDTMIVGEGESGASSGAASATGTFTFDAGTNNVNTLYLGYRVATGGSSAPTGIMNVNGTATLVANGAICLSYYVPNSGSTYGSGTLNINGGTVLASTITNGVAGGANTTANINMTGGLLGITSLLGTIGSPTSPLKALTLSDSTLQLAVSGIQTNVEVQALTLNGTTNYINISSVPAGVITYPTQIPLIAYSSITTNDVFNLVISNLPGTYQGYISNNANNLSIDLVLTSGPTSINTLEWTGLGGANWNMSSVDWNSGGSPVAYFDGAAVLFDDNATGPTSINIATPVAPASVIFSNNTLPYAFSGSGIGNSASLTKYGNGTVLFTNSGNSFAGNVTINAGTVQFGNGGTSGNLPTTGSVLDNGNLVFNHSGNVTVPNTISGSGTLTQNGSGTLTLTASNSFSGTAVVNTGTLLVNGVLSGNLANALGSTIGGSGTNAGAINVSGLIQPSASSGTPTTLTSGGNVTLASGATAAFDLSGTDTTVGNGINDLLTDGGDLDVNGNTIYLNFQGVPQPGMTYTLAYFNGVQNGTFNSTVAGTHFGAVLNQGSSPIMVTLTDSGANLEWNSTANNLWNIGSNSNWLNLASSAQDVFYQGDTVIFNDTAGVTNNISIPTGVAVSPTTISNNSSTVNYTINGPGQISGNVSIIKKGSSTLTINNANNNFTGTASVQGGKLVVGNNNAFGASGTVMVTNGGTLDINGAGLGEVTVIASGTGVNGNGAIVNSGGDQIHALNNVELSGNATFGGPGRWDIRYNGSINASLSSSDGNTYNLVKTGSNLVALVNCSISSTIGNIDIQGGTLGFQLASTATASGGWFGSGTASSTISVENGAQLEFNTLGSAYPLYQNVALNNGSLLVSDAGNNAISGGVTLQGTATISVTGGTAPWLLISGVIGGTGNLIVNGSEPLELSGASTYTGNTLVAAGALYLIQDAFGNNGSLVSSNIIVGANALLDVSQRGDQTLTLVSGQTLQGSGSVNGTLVVGAGATVSAGTNSTTTGTLTVSNNVTLFGNALMKLNPAGSTSDALNVANGMSITYGGTLTVTNISSAPFAVGNSFQLFNAGTYNGLFTSIVPATPGNGLAWNTNTLATGVLSVVAGPVTPQPAITSITLSGTSLVITGTNGLAGEQYNVLTTTNLALPIANWPVLSTGTFSAGNFSITNTVNSSVPRSFYMLRVP